MTPKIPDFHAAHTFTKTLFDLIINFTDRAKPQGEVNPLFPNQTLEPTTSNHTSDIIPGHVPLELHLPQDELGVYL